MSVSPRVNGSMLNSFINKPVRIVGTVHGYDATKSHMQLQATDAVMVSVVIAAEQIGVTWESGSIVEVIGAVQGNANPTIQEYTTIGFSKNFDLGNYEKLVQLIHSRQDVAEIFHADKV